MDQEKSKAEWVRIDKTERLDVQSADSATDNRFRGTLQKSESLNGYIGYSLS